MLDLSKIENFQDAMVTVMGLGRFKQGSGVGAAKWLMRHGAQIVITDLKSEKDLKESVEEIMSGIPNTKIPIKSRYLCARLCLGEHHADDFTNVDLVMQNPGVARESEFVQLAKGSRGSDISLFFSCAHFPFIPSQEHVENHNDNSSWKMLRRMNQRRLLLETSPARP